MKRRERKRWRGESEGEIETGSERVRDVRRIVPDPEHKPFIYMFYIMFVCRLSGLVYYVVALYENGVKSAVYFDNCLFPLLNYMV